MLIRHIVEEANVDEEGFVKDPQKARHGLVKALRILDLGGEIDPLTHLNLDFPEHRMTTCIVAERLEKGARVMDADGGLLITRVRPEAHDHRGKFDIDLRRLQWLEVHRSRRFQRGEAGARRP